MDERIRDACLKEIRQIWSAATESCRPPTVWIAEHEAIGEGDDFARSNVARAWLLHDHGLEPRSAMQYVRFIAVQSGQIWCSADIPPRSTGPFHGTGIHAIGVASFAPIMGSDLVYLDFVWGGLFGRGAKYGFDAESGIFECVQNLWLS